MLGTIAWAYCGIVMVLSMFTSGHKFKIAGSVIQAIPILVVNNLFFLKRAAQHLLHHYSVFQLPPSVICGLDVPIASTAPTSTNGLGIADTDLPLVFFSKTCSLSERIAQHPFTSSFPLGSSGPFQPLAVLLCKWGAFASPKGIAYLRALLPKMSIGEFTFRFVGSGLSFRPRHNSMVAQSTAG